MILHGRPCLQMRRELGAVPLALGWPQRGLWGTHKRGTHRGEAAGTPRAAGGSRGPEPLRRPLSAVLIRAAPGPHPAPRQQHPATPPRSVGRLPGPSQRVYNQTSRSIINRQRCVSWLGDVRPPKANRRQNLVRVLDPPRLYRRRAIKTSRFCERARHLAVNNLDYILSDYSL